MIERLESDALWHRQEFALGRKSSFPIGPINFNSFWTPPTPTSPPMPTQRQRSRKACQPCRQRKRKCDGHKPCTTCARHEYDCYYSARERGSTVSDNRHETSFELNSSLINTPTSERQVTQPAVLDLTKSRFVKASSAVAFPRLLGIEFNSSNAPRLHSFAWNLGVRPEPKYEKIDVTIYLSRNELERLSEVFFSVVHPVFCFIDREDFDQQWQSRYGPKSGNSEIDPVICGIAALGSLYSINTTQSSHPHEAELIEIAKDALEHRSTIGSPTELHVAAWILRTIYLRATTRPHASWLSSCTTMHLIEATGLHQDLSKIAIVTPAAPEQSTHSTYLRRRLFWTAWSLNTIISYECGRSRVDLPSQNVELFAVSDEIPSSLHQYISLAECVLMDESTVRSFDRHHNLLEAVSRLNRLDTTTDEMRLFKAEIAFSVYRRLRLSTNAGPGLTPELGLYIINVGIQALPSCSALAARRLPWWTVISIPFQLVCVLLAMDSKESLSHVSEAMLALEEVGKHWDTHMVREAIGSASLLVKLSKKRKEEDLRCLDDGMLKRSGPHGQIPIPAVSTENMEQSHSIPIDGFPAVANQASAFEQPARFEGTTIVNSLDWTDGADGEIPDYDIDWNTFFNTMNWA